MKQEKKTKEIEELNDEQLEKVTGGTEEGCETQNIDVSSPSPQCRNRNLVGPRKF